VYIYILIYILGTLQWFKLGLSMAEKDSFLSRDLSVFNIAAISGNTRYYNDDFYLNILRTIENNIHNYLSHSYFTINTIIILFLIIMFI
jgi:hypothetical protein